MSSGRRGDQQYVIVKNDPGDRNYWASFRMKWPEVIDDATRSRYWVSDLGVAHTYKTKVAAQRAYPDIRRRGVTIMTRGEAKLCTETIGDLGHITVWRRRLDGGDQPQQAELNKRKEVIRDGCRCRIFRRRQGQPCLGERRRDDHSTCERVL
jgi:hypothetical protein